MWPELQDSQVPLSVIPVAPPLQTLSGWKLQPAHGMLHSPWLILCFVCSGTSVMSNSWSVAHPDCSVHGILRKIILERVAIPSSREIFPTQGSNRVSVISCIGEWVLFHPAHLGRSLFHFPLNHMMNVLKWGQGKADAASEWEIFPVALDGALYYQREKRTLLWLREANKRQS